MKMRIVATLTLLACGAAAGTGHAQSPHKEMNTDVRAVVELFTSQGCSSCPPADAVLNTLAHRKDVIALTLPVDYWDYLGWKDTFASPRFSERQRAYAKSRGDGLIYTPQAVVNGLVHVNGASSSDVDQAIGKTELRLRTAMVPVRLFADKDKLVIEAGAHASGDHAAAATIWLAAVQRHGEVSIAKGENGGRKLSYTNVVRELIDVGDWNGKSAAIRVDRNSVSPAGTETYVVLIQQGHSGPIVGAAWLDGTGS